MYRNFIKFSIFFSLVFSSYNSFNQPFIDVSRNQSSTIVSILTEKITVMNDPFFYSPFEDFGFGNPFQREYQSESLGSGVIIDSENGYIITNNHVVEDAENIRVILYDKREFNAEVVGVDPLSDIAVIKIDSNNLTQATMGSSSSLQIGEWVIAIGSPFGLHLNHTVTAGIVSAVGRSNIVSRLNYENFIQHDAAINPGNSGGGLFNLSGELIGINTAIATDGFSRSNAGVGFAIPIDQVKYVIDDLINDGKVSRGWLGVSIVDIDDDMVKALELGSKQGTMISMISPNSPAFNYGLLEKDVIIAMDYKAIINANDLKNTVSIAKPNEEVILTIIRNQTKINITIILGIRPNEENISESFNPANSSFDLLGFKVENANIDGVKIIDIKQDSNARRKDIKKGDIITELGQWVIKDKESYLSVLNQYYQKGDIIMLRIASNGYNKYIAFTIE